MGIVLFRRDQDRPAMHPGIRAPRSAGEPMTSSASIPVPEEIEKRWAPFAARLDRGAGFSGLEIRIMRKDGSEFDAALACAPLADERGRPAGFVANIEDISDRKRADEALRRSEAYLTEAQRLSHTGKLGAGHRHGQQTIPPRSIAAVRLRSQRDRPSSAELHQRIHPEDRSRIADILEKAARERIDYEVDYRVVFPDGTVKCIHAVGHPCSAPRVISSSSSAPAWM